MDWILTKVKMKKYLFIILISNVVLSSCNSVKKEITLDLNDFNDIGQIYEGKIEENSDSLYLHVYKDKCGSCFQSLINWEMKFKSGESKREENIILIYGEDKIETSFLVNQRLKVGSKIFYYDQKNEFPLEIGSYLVSKQGSQIKVLQSL